MPKNLLTPPEKSLSDDLHSLTKGTLSCIPGVGGVVAELFEKVITPPLARRREVWMNQVAEALNELRETILDFSWDKLREDETFLDIFSTSWPDCFAQPSCREDRGLKKRCV